MTTFPCFIVAHDCNGMRMHILDTNRNFANKDKAYAEILCLYLNPQPINNYS